MSELKAVNSPPNRGNFNLLSLTNPGCRLLSERFLEALTQLGYLYVKPQGGAIMASQHTRPEQGNQFTDLPDLILQINREKQLLDRYLRALFFISQDGVPIEDADIYALQQVFDSYGAKINILINEHLPKGEGRDSK